MYDPMPVFVPARPNDYPVEWRNKDTGLEVRITLPELPPGMHFEWDSAEFEDVILISQQTRSRSASAGSPWRNGTERPSSDLKRTLRSRRCRSLTL
jgi:hypothetical protein